MVQSIRANLVLLLSAALLTSPAFASHIHRSPTAGRVHHSHKSSSHRRSHRIHGQQAIDPERVIQIQQALIKAHYLTGDADGKWDTDTIAAMQKYQGDNGWQTKLMPDSRALVKLGLGPDYSDAINAKNASFNTAPPTQDSSIPASQEAGFAAAAGLSSNQ